ncbi:MAG: hypothetical protein CME62_02680 [Halobacteriovoraceae bacterium]|nr:hypothetical protein [Halobacteriovoraceae bacterium]
MKNDSGFTLVEMMIAIAIIGVLAAVTVPNFKKYQAKSKVVEAKMQLASAYTAEKGFYQLFDMYATCLDYMGFDPTNEIDRRHFAIGFPNFQANIDPGFYNSAVGERMVASECPRDLVDTPGSSVFLAGKAVGSAVMNTLADFQAAVPVTSNDISMAGPVVPDDVQSGLGTQSDNDSQTFVIAAAGYIDSQNLTPDVSALWSIDQDKKIKNHRPGY